MAGPADQQAQRGLQNFDERPDVAGQRPDLRGLGVELLQRGGDGSLNRGSASPSDPSLVPSGFTTMPSAGPHVSSSRLEGGDHADRALLLQGHPEGSGNLRRSVGWFDEHLDRTVAAETQAPDVVVVGGQVPAGQAGPTLLHHDREPCPRRRPPGTRRRCCRSARRLRGPTGAPPAGGTSSREPPRSWQAPCARPWPKGSIAWRRRRSRSRDRCYGSGREPASRRSRSFKRAPIRSMVKGGLVQSW